jgi:hypothetical protein
MIFHVLNRGVGRMRRFLKDADFEAFERNILKTLESRPRIARIGGHNTDLGRIAKSC